MKCRLACKVCGCVLFTISCSKEKSSVCVWGGGQSARQGNPLLSWKMMIFIALGTSLGTSLSWDRM